MATWSNIKISELKEAMRIDPEYYQPAYLTMDHQLAKCRSVSLDTISIVTDGIHASPIIVENGGMRYLSAKCVKDNAFFLDTAIQISFEQNAANKRTQIQEGDVLLTTVGTIGNAAVVSKEILPANIDRHLGLIRLKKDTDIDPFYLSTFLNSKFGRFQTIRKATGNVQLNLFIEKIKVLRIPILPCVQEVSQKTQDAYAKCKQAATLYYQAESLLLSELKLDNFDMGPALFYETTFADIKATGRFDAEYYQPKYYKLIGAIRSSKHAFFLGDIVSHCDRGLQPIYDDGEIAVINTKHLGACFHDSEFEHCTNELWMNQKKAQLKKFDVLLYGTGAYIGRTNCFLYDGKAIGSNHVTIIRTKETCNPLYLSLFLNSQAGLLQADRHAHGSAQRELYPDDVRNYTVWLPPMKMQEKFAKMILSAYAAREESRRLLNEATQMVEDMILHK